MAIRRPSISSPEWLFQDFLYQSMPGEEDRYLQVKWDGEVYTRTSQSFDYSDPPFVGSEQRGGSIVAQIDYTVSVKMVTITGWEVNWRDEWPLRLGIIYLRQCLYSYADGYIIRVVGDEVYNQAGEAIPAPNKDPYPFWVSEQFDPYSNRPDNYLLH